MNFYNQYHEYPWPKPGYPAHVPVAVPTSGDYSHWMVVRGINTNESLWGHYPDFPDVTIYGFWLNDPSTGGIGSDSFKTTETWLSDYYHPLNVVGDTYNGKYLAIMDPYPGFDTTKTDAMTITLAPHTSTLTLKQATVLHTILTTPSPAYLKHTAYTRLYTTAQHAILPILSNDQNNPDLYSHFLSSQPANAFYVTNPTGSDYWLIVFGDQTFTLVGRFDATQGSLLEFSTSLSPVDTYLHQITTTNLIHTAGSNYYYPTSSP